MVSRQPGTRGITRAGLPERADSAGLTGTADPDGPAVCSGSPSPRAPVLRIADFGLARLMETPGEEATLSFRAMGTAAYMAPEQAEGKKVGPAADIYSLGAILYVLLCNRPPHRGANDIDTLRRVVSDDPVAPRALRRTCHAISRRSASSA